MNDVEQVKNRVTPKYEETNQLLNCLVKQNEELINLFQSEVERTEETNKRLESIDRRQSKQDRINMPSIFVATVAGYCAIHVYYLGEEHLRQTLIALFDKVVRVADLLTGLIV